MIFRVDGFGPQAASAAASGSESSSAWTDGNWVVLSLHCGLVTLFSSVSVDFSNRLGSWETTDVLSGSFTPFGFFFCVVPSDHLSTKDNSQID